MYLNDFGRLTITAVTLFERLRGYRVAIRDEQWSRFEKFFASLRKTD